MFTGDCNEPAACGKSLGHTDGPITTKINYNKKCSIKKKKKSKYFMKIFISILWFVQDNCLYL